MFDRTQLVEALSGRRTDWRARCVRAVAACGEPCYAAGTMLRNLAFDRQWRQQTAAGVPVVSVGNITAGGTGKTPMVEWVSRWFREYRVRVCILSRGYGAEAGAVNDEALELEKMLPDVPHLQNSDRVAAAEVAVNELEMELLLLDDGFQHRRIARDLDLVLIDALEPFGYGHLLPRGLLRESLHGLRRADLVVLSRADQVSSERRDEIWRTVARYVGDQPRVDAVHRPRCLRQASGDESPVETLQGSRVAAFCGIGNPAAFRRTLENCGCEVVAWREFPDHHPYTRNDLEQLAAWTENQPVDWAICTGKDLVKLGIEQLGTTPLAALEVGMEIVAGGEAVTAELEKILGLVRRSQLGEPRRESLQ